jgi:hypothetical protein
MDAKFVDNKDVVRVSADLHCGATSHTGIKDFSIGNFVSDNRADVFFADGRNWWVSQGGVSPS